MDEAKPSLLMLSEIRGEAEDFMFHYVRLWVFNWYSTTNETFVKVINQHLYLNNTLIKISCTLINYTCVVE